MMNILETARERLAAAAKVAVLTGAGVSAESGIPTFRGPEGLWRNYRPEDLATPEAYARNPQLVWEWYAMRLGRVRQAQPNAAHLALAQLGQRKDVHLVTQNVDGLHQTAGSRQVLELHGNLNYSRCERCFRLDYLPDNPEIPPRCTDCNARARPNVVWFGEELSQEILRAAITVFADCELALVIGTAGVVEPAASLARLAATQGTTVIEINLHQTVLSAVVDISLRMSAVQAMKQLTTTKF